MRSFEKHLFDGPDALAASWDNSAFFGSNADFGDPGASNAASGASFGALDAAARRHTPSTPVPTPVTPPVSLPTVPASPSAFTIDINWDSSVDAAPSGFTSGILAAVNFLETQFTDPVTITLNVGYGEIAGLTLGDNDLGESMASMLPVSYASLLSALATNATTATDARVVAALPAASPVGDATYYVTTSQAKALGLEAATDTDIDGSVGFATSSEFTYGETNTSGTVAAGTYDFFATALHEITEVMGRQLLTGTTESGTRDSYTLLDLLHYSAPGTIDLSATTPGYFSPNGGTTNLGAFNTDPNGDSGDWAASVPDNSFDAFATPGVLEAVSPNDLTEMDAIGWQPAGSGGTPVETPPPASGRTGVVFTPETQFLAIGQGCGELSAGSPLATVTEVGGIAGDQFSYALSGPGAASFSLDPMDGGAVLAIGPNAATGAEGGALYALTVTATDETAAGNPSAAGPANVVFGDNGDDTINVASLPGIVASAPSFIYGLAGNDTINGTGMTGTLYLDSGTGDDTMTGGGGMNVYEFGIGGLAVAGSTQDIITNFNVAVDLIDLTWIGWRFGGVAALGSSATMIAADSIGWRNSGGNTFVYANSGNQPEALTATDMKIELQGNIALTTANFAHA